MKIDILFKNLKPLSLNNAQKISTRGRFATKYKTAECKKFESTVTLQLKRYKDEIKKFNTHYSKSNFYIAANYRFYMPILVKNKSRISKNSTDLSNVVKILEDVIFKELDADDSEVAILNVMKVHSEEMRMEVTLELVGITIKQKILNFCYSLIP